MSEVVPPVSQKAQDHRCLRLVSRIICGAVGPRGWSVQTRDMRICFVCMGNICRSPAAKAIMGELVARRGLDVAIGAAGTAGYHVGEPPHDFTVAEAQRRGLALQHAATQISRGDFAAYDLVVAMDEANEQELLHLAPTPEDQDKVVRVGVFGDPEHGLDAESIEDIADTWGRPAEDFSAMFDALERHLSVLADLIEQGRVNDYLRPYRAARPTA